MAKVNNPTVYRALHIGKPGEYCLKLPSLIKANLEIPLEKQVQISKRLVEIGFNQFQLDCFFLGVKWTLDIISVEGVRVK